MSEFHVSVEIAAPIEHVWSILADVARWPEWTESVASVSPLDATPIGVGSRVRIHQPKLRPAVMTVTEWEPGRRFVWVTRSFGVAVTAEHTLAPTPAGCTLTLDLRFEGLLGGFAGAVGRKLTTAYMDLEANGLKARSEGRK